MLLGALILNGTFAIAVNRFVFQLPLIGRISSATHGWISPTLLVNVGGFLVVPFAWLMLYGRLSPRRLGLRWAAVPAALAVVTATWLTVQLFAAVGALSRGTSLTEISPEFVGGLPVLLGQLAGNALYEETFYRGFLIPAMTRALGNRPWFAVMASGALFGLMHVPNYLARDLSLVLLIPAVLTGILWGPSTCAQTTSCCVSAYTRS